MADVAHSTTTITGGHANVVAAGAAGFMTGADKTKLDGIASGAQVVNDANVRAAAATFSAALAVNGQQITGGAAGTSQTDFTILSQTAPGMLNLWSMQKNKGSTATCFMCTINGNPAIIIPDTVESSSKYVMAQPGTATALYVKLTGTTIADSLTFTVRKNGVDQAITCQIAGTGTSANDTGHSFSWVAGDDISIKVVQSSTAASVVVNVTASLAWRAT